MFWDAATFGLIDERSQHLSFGEFSSKFAEAAAAGAAPRRPRGHHEPSRAPTRCRVANPDVDLYALTHNETSTGVAMTIAPARGRRRGLVAVDATSAAGGLRVDPAEFDVYYFAPQKCFASDGGLWLALCSPAAHRADRADRGLRSMDPRLARPDDGRSTTPARTRRTTRRRWPRSSWPTADRVDERQRRPRVGRRRAATARPRPLRLGRDVRRTPRRSSPTRTSAATSSAPSTSTTRSTPTTVSQVLRANGIVDTEAYRKLGRNQLRIALFPAIEPDDVAALTALHRPRRRPPSAEGPRTGRPEACLLDEARKPTLRSRFRPEVRMVTVVRRRGDDGG